MKPLNNYMSKKILIVGASGLVGGEILENLKTTNNRLSERYEEFIRDFR